MAQGEPDVCGLHQQVKLLGSENGDRVLQRVYIKLRINVGHMGISIGHMGISIGHIGISIGHMGILNRNRQLHYVTILYFGCDVML